jgi:isoquinoline 1-oxidoreductase beta subunit
VSGLRSPDRRRVLQAGGALVLAFQWPVSAAAREAAAPFAPNAWLRIASDGAITVLVEKPELGQGSHTAVPMMIAEELEADLAAIRVEQAPTIPAIYKNLRTGGSGGVPSSFTPMRRVGAQAREMLITAAARRWRTAREACRAERGAVVHTPTGRRLTYGQLAQAAARLPPPDPAGLVLKPRQAFKVIGTSQPRTDAPAKADGSAAFGLDVRLPGMLFAVIARCPVFGGRLKSFDATAAKQMPGVRAVFEVPPLPRRLNTAGGVAVVATSTWAAIQARKALTIAWDEGPGAAQTVEATYESPFQAHATMEPMNTTVHVRPGDEGGEVEVWSPTQFAAEVQAAIAKLAGLPPEKVIVHMTLSGGSFGRRYQWDYPAEAWQVAQAMDAPVQLVWTREDDTQHDFYRPYNLQRLRAAFDGEGRLAAWSTRIVTTPIAATNLYTDRVETPEALSDPAVIAELEWFGSDVAPYAIPGVRVDYAPAQSVVPRSWWRGVPSSFTPFAKECFLDELAHARGRDPLDFRLDLLNSGSQDAARLKAVLELVADKAGWREARPTGRGLGLACRMGESCIAQVAEVSVDAQGAVSVHRVVSAIDCGLAVNPDGVRAMIEGGVNFALGATLYSQITVKGGRVEQSNFHDFPVLRINQAPRIETHIAPSDRAPGGVGEIANMVAPPTLVNAIFAATGVRVRRLPVGAQLKSAAPDPAIR